MPAKRSSRRNSTSDKRSSILRAATRVFARNGYFNSKVADIARAADVADGTVYLYFKSKEEILHSIFDQNIADAIEAARRLIENVRDPRDKLRRIAALHLERLGADRDLAIVFQVELRGSTKFMREFSAAGFAEYLALLRQIFEEGQAAGVFRKELHAKAAAKILFGALDEMATNWIISKRNYKLAPMADVVMEVFLNGVNTGTHASGVQHAGGMRTK
ncbi:MAG TPA: TetR/AcrR family transcriptional regulator [Pyrinomonadaceae bacterium]|nr:TetR/AcrR family transcriptional regulator [Pyrinomonadaceae bacterium]